MFRCCVLQKQRTKGVGTSPLSNYHWHWHGFLDYQKRQYVFKLLTNSKVKRNLNPRYNGTLPSHPPTKEVVLDMRSGPSVSYQVHQSVWVVSRISTFSQRICHFCSGCAVFLCGRLSWKCLSYDQRNMAIFCEQAKNCISAAKKAYIHCEKLLLHYSIIIIISTWT